MQYSININVNIIHLHRNFCFFIKSLVIVFNSCLSEGAASSLNSNTDRVSGKI